MTDVAIIGAGPYGLSIAAHLQNLGIAFRIFGVPMHSWRNRMPAGMSLKSDGFASRIFDPEGSWTLRRYSIEHGLPYQDVGYAVPLETFIHYGLEFQRRQVPSLEQTNVVSLSKERNQFALQTAEGEWLSARRVIVAVGITHFGYVPSQLSSLGRDQVTHSSEHHDFAAFRGLRVAVIGGGSSAIDTAALMHESGVDVQLIARRGELLFHSPSKEPRPLLQRMLNPRSGLGTGWRSRLCTDAPLLFHAMPLRLRLRAVQRHLGPAGGWFIRDRLIGRVPVHVGAEVTEAVARGSHVHLTYRQHEAGGTTVVVDHVVAATGFRVAMRRLPFLDARLRDGLRCVEDAPVLNRNFEASVPGLYFVGLASANSFGPLVRFAYGAGFTARHLTSSLKKALGSASSEPVAAAV
jgi:cation diffusion facilitator CzcD-associated flavoprotein CzcO